jgi:hypothetical protein
MANKKRSINPWVGKPSQSSEPDPFRGRRHYYQVAFFDGKKQSTKKAYFLEGDDRAKAEALNTANGFRTKKARELNVILQD